MADSASSKPGPRPLLAITAFIGVASLVAGLAWYAARPASPSGASPAPPPAPPIPKSQLVTTPAPVAAPAIDLPTADGKRFSLAAARGQVVVVNLWATWCPPCVQEMPSLVALGRELARSHPGRFRVVAVSLDDAAGAVDRFFAAAAYGGLPGDLVVALEPGGGEVARGLACRGRGACRPEEVALPETYLVDREGRIVALAIGALDWSSPVIRQYLEALLSG